MSSQHGDAPHLAGLFPNHDFLSMWQSPESFSRHVEALDEKKAWHKTGWKEGNVDFCGTKTWDEAIRIGKEGWEEGARKVKRLQDLILATNPILKKPVQYGIVGAVPSVPRAVAGNPLNMRMQGSVISRRRPVISLISDMSAHCGINKEAICNRAAAVATIIDQIEAAGYACEVLSTACTEGYTSGKYKAVNVIISKESHQPVDIKRLSFGLGHVSLFRRMVFADWGSDHKNSGPLGRGLGHTYAFNAKEYNDKNYYVIPSAENRSEFFATDETTAKEGLPYLIQKLQFQGCPAFPLTPKEREDMIKIREEQKKKYDW